MRYLGRKFVLTGRSRVIYILETGRAYKIFNDTRRGWFDGFSPLLFPPSPPGEKGIPAKFARIKCIFVSRVRSKLKKH